MVNLSLSIMPVKCRHVECFKMSGVFGVCSDHEEADVRRMFMAAVKEGICSYDRPPCFRSDKEWREYVVAVMLCRNQHERKAAPIEFCRDCTPEYKDEMMGCGRCGHPEAVFIRSERHNGDVIAVAVEPHRKTTAVWESAVMGMAGDVVRLPPADVLEEVLSKIGEVSAPKKRGPRFKKDRLSA